MEQDAQQWLHAVQQHLGTGQLDIAERMCNERLAAHHEDADALHVLGWLLHQKNDRAGAESALRRAIASRPSDALFHNTLAAIHASRGEFAAAEESANHALRLNPRFTPAQWNIGEAQYQQGHLDEAIASFSKAAAMSPSEPMAYISLAAAFAGQGRHQEVLDNCAKAIHTHPNQLDLYHHLLYYLWFAPGIPRQAIVEQHAVWGNLASPFARNSRPHDNDPNPNRRLRIGYVSPDLRDHPIGYFLAPILPAHDRQNVEIFCYFHGPRDRLTDQLQSSSDHWLDTHALDDDQLADRIRADRIDVLVDLSLHMAMNRLILFTRRPAPVQATYLSYPGTSGLPQMDYRITDPWMEPPDRPDGWLGPEKLARLQDCYWCYRPPPEAPAVAEPPSARNGFVTFACTNNFMKVTQPMIALWAQILRQVPNARLWCYIRGGEPHNRSVVQTFLNAGIERSRFQLRPQLPYSKYLDAYRDVDIALDCFPYNGGTTTFDSLYMGIPVITLAGELPVSRLGLTILQNLGLSDLIATTPDQYITRAVNLAHDFPLRSNLRNTLRPKLQNSHLTNAKHFTRHLETVYRSMWQTWCAVSPKRT